MLQQWCIRKATFLILNYQLLNNISETNTKIYLFIYLDCWNQGGKKKICFNYPTDKQTPKPFFSFVFPMMGEMHGLVTEEAQFSSFPFSQMSANHTTEYRDVRKADMSKKVIHQEYISKCRDWNPCFIM